MTTHRFAPVALAAALSTLATTIAAEPTAARIARYSAASGLVVTTTADMPSPCNVSAVSLRCAIDQANGDTSGDLISFAIPPSDKGCSPQTIQGSQVSVCTIAIKHGELVLRASATTIDGYTQPGSRASTGSIGSGTGDNAVLTIQLHRARTGGGAGLDLAGKSDTVTGLAITGAPGGFPALQIDGSGTTIAGDFIGITPAGKRAPNGIGIVVNAPSTVIGGTAPAATNVISANAGAGISLEHRGSGTTIQGNLVGTDPSGTRAAGNGTGLVVADSNDNMIGGQALGAGNVFSASGSSGIALQGHGNIVQGNFIGIDVTGNRALGNGHDGSPGLNLFTKTPAGGNNLIGGTDLGTINVISGNLADGIELSGDSAKLTQGNVIEGNAIGSAPDGKSGLPNRGNGIFVQHDVNGASIGGTVQESGNLIAFNGGSGVLVGGGPSETGVHVAVEQNIMFQNGGLGIDLSPQGVVNCTTSPPGPNDYVPCPVIAVATTTSASGSACGMCRVEVYFATNEKQSQGHGEAQELLGTTTSGPTGAWSAQFTLGKVAPGDPITATATAPATKKVSAETSEFAANVPATSLEPRRRIRKSPTSGR